MTLKLNLDFENAATPDSVGHAEFKKSLVRDLSTAAEMPLEHFWIKQLASGSIGVCFKIGVDSEILLRVFKGLFCVGIGLFCLVCVWMVLFFCV